MKLEILLQFAAAIQLGIAILNLFITRLLDWEQDLARMPVLLREVFHVHAWFISITLAIFAVMTWRFAGAMGSGTNEELRWLAACLGIFWATRTVLQVVYYSNSHWRGRPGRTVIHATLLLLYGGVAALYLWSAFSPR
jgi:hypothetical protein